MNILNLFKNAKNAAKLKKENAKLIMDNHNQYEEYCVTMDKLHCAEMEIERLNSENTALNMRAEAGVKQGKDEMIAALKKAIAMPCDELKDYSDDRCLNGAVFVSFVDDENMEHFGKWAVHDRICQYGGCEMPSYYKNECSARIYAAALNIAKVPLIRDLCPECAKEMI